MGTYSDDFISKYKQRILWEWNASKMLEEYTGWLVMQPEWQQDLVFLQEQVKQEKADENYEDR